MLHARVMDADHIFSTNLSIRVPIHCAVAFDYLPTIGAARGMMADVSEALMAVFWYGWMNEPRLDQIIRAYRTVFGG